MDINKVYFGHNCNTYIIGEEGKDAIVIDPGYDHDGILTDYLKTHYKNIHAFLLTHAHFDHISGLKTLLKAFPSAKVLVHEQDAESLHNPRLNCSFLAEKDEDKNISLDIEPYILEDEDEIKIVNHILKVIHTPFHTSGSVCYYDSDAKVLFSGDTLFYHSIGRSDLPTSQERNIHSSLAKLMELDDDVIVYPGHGQKTSIKEERLFVKRYL